MRGSAFSFPIRCISIMAVLIVATAARAETQVNGPGAFVTSLGDRTISFLTDKTASRELQEYRLRKMLREGFAVKSIGRFVLGKYRRNTPRETVNEFVNVFEDYIVSLYASQFIHFSGEGFAVQKVVKTRRAKDSMVVTKITPTNGREPLRVDFQVRNHGDNFKILDVRVEGVSMVLAQREEFTAYIGHHGGKVQALIAALRKRMTNHKAGAQ
jgi:phospholipid transport system substrate-binding protein